MVDVFLFVGCLLGNASFGIGDAGLLEGAVWQQKFCNNMESGSFVSHVANLEECNAHCFDDLENSTAKLKFLFLRTLYEQTSLLVPFSDEGLLDFIESTYISQFFLFLADALYFLFCTLFYHFSTPCLLELHFLFNEFYLPTKEKKKKKRNWLLFVRIFQLSGSCVLVYKFFCKRSGSQEERFLLVCSQFYVIVVQIIML